MPPATTPFVSTPMRPLVRSCDGAAAVPAVPGAPTPARASSRPSKGPVSAAQNMPPSGLPPAQLVVQGRDLGGGSCELQPTRFPGTAMTVSMFQHIGDRPRQEDRFTVAPNLLPGRPANPAPGSLAQAAFFGVFDGTVGEFASDNVKDIVLPKLFESRNWQQFLQTTRTADQDRLLEAAIRDMYRASDHELLIRCAKAQLHYTTCTSVTLMVVGDMIAVGHIGDSRIALGKEVDGCLKGEQMTMDHKPDADIERQRIEHCGGMVERLTNHNYKPFIRGGDFLMRKALGEQPMQLMYSRAFGCKDLKIFGLSCEPEVKILRAGSEQYRHVRFAILASDGLWDVMTAQEAVTMAHKAAQAGKNPSEVLVHEALNERSRRKARADNVTAVVVQFD